MKIKLNIMRTIKFRAWNGVEMIYPNTNGWYNKLFAGDNGVMQDVRLGTMINSEDKGVVPMQFTGLLDKNGVEIYEGDVVLVQGSFNANIYYSRFCSFDVATTGNSVGFYNRADIEVISNIHKNPELIK